MGHKLFIHLGMPKTGTSSLQKFMTVNNDVLNKYGWNYPDGREIFSGDTNESMLYVNDGNWLYLRTYVAGETCWKPALDSFHEKLRDSLTRYDTILSNELIWPNGKEYIAYLHQFYKNMVLIVYLRRQDYAMESWYGEKVKSHPHMTESFQEWCAREMERESNGALYYRYYERLMEFEKIVGRENIIVRSYNKVKGDSLYRDFLSILDLEEQMSAFRRIRSENASVSVVDLEAKRRLHCLFQSENTRAVLQKEYWDTYKSTGASASVLRFNRKERRDILDRYAEQNRKVEERYRNGARLFDDSTDLEPPEISQSEVQSQYVRLLEKLLVRVCSRQYSFMALFFAGARDIALFGAGSVGRRMMEESRFPARIIMDNNETLAGQTIRGIPIVSPKEITDWKRYFVVIAVVKHAEIEKQMESLGLEKNVDFMYFNDVLSGGYDKLKEYDESVSDLLQTVQQEKKESQNSIGEAVWNALR